MGWNRPGSEVMEWLWECLKCGYLKDAACEERWALGEPLWGEFNKRWRKLSLFQSQERDFDRLLKNLGLFCQLHI